MRSQRNSSSEMKYTLYLYDLPKTEELKEKIRNAFIEGVKIWLTDLSISSEDNSKKFLSAKIKMSNKQSFKEACDKMKYFKIDGKPCRALPYAQDIMNWDPKLKELGVYISGFASSYEASKIEGDMSKYGEVLTVVIQRDSHHSSKGYGYVCFVRPDGA